MAAIKKTDSTDAEANQSTADSIRFAYPQIASILWSDQLAIIGDDVISMVALSLYHFSRVPGLHT